MSDMAGAQLLRLGGKAQESIDLAIYETIDEFDVWIGYPVDALDGVKAELGGDQGQQHVRGRPQGLHSDALGLQVGDPANTLVPEQFDTADMDASEQRNRLAGLDRLDELRGVAHTEIDVPTPQCLP